MGRRSHTRTLGLWMNGARVGTWSLAPNAPDVLQYDLAWTQSGQGRPLSLSLPLPVSKCVRVNRPAWTNCISTRYTVARPMSAPSASSA